MKQLFTFVLVLICITSFGQQLQKNAPWATNALSKNSGNPTLEQITKSAEDYFSTIDRNKKGSGLKPFERWRFHWSHFLDENGRIQSSKTLWDAWERKNAMNASSRMVDVSNWTSVGPFSNSNTYSASSLQQTGQGRINAIAVDPNNSSIIYVGAPAGGIWKSIDNGVNWTPLTDHLPQIGVSGIAIDPVDSNIIYIATGDDDAGDSSSVGVWKSSDGGTTWNATGSMVGNPNSMNDIYILPTNTIMVATNNGIHKSTDGGVSWTRKLSGNIRALRMRPNDFSSWYAVSSSIFYKSIDGGETFQSVSITGLSGASRLEIDVTPANADYIYIVKANSGNTFGGIWKSTDSGTSFNKTSETSDIFRSSQSWYDLALAVSSNDPDILYVGVLDIWKSTDGGDNFSQINQWNNPNVDSYTHADIHFLRFIDDKFYAGTDGGVYVSINEGNKFTDLTENLAISQFYRVSVSPQNSNNIVGGIQDNGGYASNDSQWRNYHGGDGMEGVAHPTEPNTHYGFTQYGGNLFKTTNGGGSNTWVTGAPSQGEWVTPMSINSQGEVFAGYEQLYKLAGNSWSVVSSHSFGGDDLDQIEIDPNNNNNIYVTQSSGLYRSVDQGVTFTTLSFGFGFINAIEVSHNDSNTAWIVVSGGVYKTTNLLDTAPTFTNITGNLPSESKLSIMHHERSGNNTIYLGTALGVYFINDDMSTWETFDNNLPNVAVRDLDINEEDAKLIAGTYGRGIFVSDIPRQLPLDDV
ncbi:MAG: glycosyl hydrolase, partial [Flavobacteriaceae bacterium]|nr:glycosyl hydrolase [Flavobacteriaceae bacterium]